MNLLVLTSRLPFPPDRGDRLLALRMLEVLATRHAVTLASFVEGSLARLSQVVARLEKHGWVRRTPDPTDGRYTLAILTEVGWDKVVATAPGHVEAVRSYVFDPLTKAQQRQLRYIGRRVVRAVDPSACLTGRPESQELR